MTQNIKFSYYYRDGSNYKNHGFLIFSNPTRVEIEDLSALILAELIDETWFYAADWLLPDLRSSCFDYHDDPTWHEFKSVAYTDEQPNTTISLDEIIVAIRTHP